MRLHEMQRKDDKSVMMKKVYSRIIITIIILIIIIIIIKIITKSSLVIHILCICYEILMQHKGYNKFPISFRPSRCSMDMLNIPPTQRWCNQLCGQPILVHLQKIDWIRSRCYVQLYRFHCNLNSHVLNHLLILRLIESMYNISIILFWYLKSFFSDVVWYKNYQISIWSL